MFDFWARICFMPDGGADGGAAGGGEGGFTGVDGQDAAGNEGRGAEGAAQGDNANNPTVPDAKARKAEFARLIREVYPDEYKEHTQKMIQGRLKSSKAAEEKLAALEPALALLKRQYGKEDLAELAAAVTGDDHWYEAEAQRRGMDTQTLKLLEQQEQTINAFRQEQQAQHEQREKAQQVMKWRNEETALRDIYPSFSLDEEIEGNEEFFNLLRNGISVRHAYETIHMDEIMGQTVAGAVQRTAQRTMDSIRANGMRPAENGAGKTPAKHVRTSVKDLTPEQMRAIEKRLMAGETITPDKIG